MKNEKINGFDSATLAFVNFKKAIDVVADQINSSTIEYVKVTNRLHEMANEKNKELDRILYLREIQNYTGYKITVFADIKNIEN